MMTDREKHLSLALDALTMLQERIENDCNIPGFCHLHELDLIQTATGHIEAAAIPKPSIIRRLFERRAA